MATPPPPRFSPRPPAPSWGPPAAPAAPAGRAGAPTGGARRTQRARTVNKTRNGGGINPSINPALNINITKNSGGSSAGQGAGTASGGTGGGVPGAGFMSNEDIQKFSEYLRKEGRKRAGERAMDAEQLEQVLRNIPDSTGSMAGSRMRARRVSRHLKRIAKAEQLVAKEAAALYSQFEREYEADLRKISAARPKQPRTNFKFR